MGMRKGFSPATILFIAAAIAIVLIAFASFQIQASYLTPKAKIHSNELERSTRDAKLLTPILTERSAALASYSLGEKGGEATNRSWYCNQNSPPSLEQLQLSFCDEAAVIFSAYSNLSQPYCLKPVLSNLSLAGAYFEIEPLGSELNLSSDEGFSAEATPPKITISGNRYWLLASNISNFFSQSNPASSLDSLLSKPCQARRCSCGSSVPIDNSAAGALNLTEDEVSSALESIAANLTASFSNPSISCTFSILSLNITNTPASSQQTALGCACANTETSTPSNWAAMNSAAPEPFCEGIQIPAPARCGPFRSASILPPSSQFLTLAARELGPLSQECSLPNSTCAFSHSIIFSADDSINDTAFQQLRASLENGSVVIASIGTYTRLRDELGVAGENTKLHPDSPEVLASYFSYNTSGAIILPQPIPENLSLAPLYSELYREIADELTSPQSFALAPCPTSSSLTLNSTNTTQLAPANSTHSLLSVSRELALSAKITCTDSQSIIATKDGITPLSFSVSLNFNKKRDCPLPLACASESICEAPS